MLDFFRGNVSGHGTVDLVPLPACFLWLLLQQWRSMFSVNTLTFSVETNGKM